jgi:hypothetical protein
MCRKLAQAAGIVRVVWPDGEESFEKPIPTEVYF